MAKISEVLYDREPGEREVKLMGNRFRVGGQDEKF